MMNTMKLQVEPNVSILKIIFIGQIAQLTGVLSRHASNQEV